ncbi:shikimate dehydrogenase [Pedobacter sp. UYP30]|uniref:shikimate dehydrogenase family protein n=1 Tax=Pedobacter sp. UYP30 TaxID=1756400 RepID=UPI003394F112
MKTFGLIGFPLSHSFSKKHFTEKFEKEHILECGYELFPIDSISLFPALLEQHPSLCGLNVTIPYKVEVLPFLTEMDDAAAKIGAVNCIDIKTQGQNKILKGYNTDAFGFEESLKPLLKLSKVSTLSTLSTLSMPQHTKALVFGNGGASKAVKYVLRKLNIDFLSVVRTKQEGAILYSEITNELLKTHTILINTTPLGMTPNTEGYPELNYDAIGPDHLAYDLVYNPLETTFLKQAAKQGAVTKNGLEMLHLQAEQAWTIWNK